MNTNISIHWFRQDLRLSDNPALTAAAKHGTVLPIYILDTQNAGRYTFGAASKVWLHHSLEALNKSLDGNLQIFVGDPLIIINQLIEEHTIQAVYWNRCYEPWQIQRDSKIKESLQRQDIVVESHNGSLLWEPWDVQKNDGTPYKVFTPFYRKGCMNAKAPRQPLAIPSLKFPEPFPTKNDAGSLNLLSDIKWHKKMEKLWTPGEDGAAKCFQNFLDTGLEHYKIGRDVPAEAYTSRLSSHLHFGEISPNQIWHTVKHLSDDSNTDHFCSELGWREFSYSLLYYNPDLPCKNLQAKFDNFQWQTDICTLKAWQTGQTGIPMVDAGMRELWETGYMHNRVRMIVGSFLVKNLRLHWEHGERWFWDTLLDADLANNAASWQWVAGCGADAAPYFRVFNPVTQGKKFDPDGAYVRRYIPELENLPDKYIHNPWEAPEDILNASNVVLDENYPRPIVDLKLSRQQALDAFALLKQ